MRAFRRPNRMCCRCALLDPADMQTGMIKIHLIQRKSASSLTRRPCRYATRIIVASRSPQRFLPAALISFSTSALVNVLGCGPRHLAAV